MLPSVLSQVSPGPLCSEPCVRKPPWEESQSSGFLKLLCLFGATGDANVAVLPLCGSCWGLGICFIKKMCLYQE